MSWLPQFSAPAMGWLAAAAVPLVTLYFLKLRRPRRTVPSLALWRSVLEDQRVNSPFQRFKRNLLLLLQLLLLACLVLAAMRPFLSGGGFAGDSVPVVVDVSASMGAVDEAGVSTLDRVKEELRETVDALPDSTRLAIIAAGTRAARLSDFTSDRARLLAAIEKLRPEPVATNLAPALRLAEGLTRSAAIEELRLYSDGNLEPDPSADGETSGVATVPFDLPFAVDFRRVGGVARPNVGVVGLAAARGAEDTWDLFVRVGASDAAAGRADLEVVRDGRSELVEPVTVEAGQTRRLAFSLPAGAASDVEVRLTPKGPDALASDDAAFLTLPATRKLSVNVDGSLAAFRYAAEGIADARPVEEGGDLVVTPDAEGVAAPPLELVVGAVPKELERLVQIVDGDSEVVDWQRADPLLRHVQLSDVQFLSHPEYAGGAGRRDLEELGYRVVAENADGPLILRAERNGGLRYVLLFDPDESTLPFRVGFPVMVANAADLARRRAELSDVQGRTAGVLEAVRVGEPGEYEVVSPSGEATAAAAGEDGLVRGVTAPEVGRYVVRRGGEDVAAVGVSLISPTETRLSGVEEIRFADVTVAATEGEAAEDRAVWRWLAWGALALLLIEWAYFHRPPALPPRPAAA